MGVPYEIKPLTNIDVTGQPVVIAIDWPNRSIISKIVVTTQDGAGEAFGVTLYNHEQVDGGAPASASLSEGDNSRIPDECFQVTPKLLANGLGRLLYFSDTGTGGYGFVFYSQTPTPGRQGQHKSKLYLKIEPVSSTPKRLSICIGGTKEVE